MPNSTFQLEKQDLMNVTSGGWINSKVYSLIPFFEVTKQRTYNYRLLPHILSLCKEVIHRKYYYINVTGLYGVL